MAKLVVHRRAANYLRKLPRDEKERIKTSLRQLRESPLTYPGNIEMAGDWAGCRRIRIGPWRVIYWFDEPKETVYVDHIGPRGDIYKIMVTLSPKSLPGGLSSFAVSGHGVTNVPSGFLTVTVHGFRVQRFRGL